MAMENVNSMQEVKAPHWLYKFFSRLDVPFHQPGR